MYELERLAQDVFFEVFDQLGDSVGVGPGFAPVVAGPPVRGYCSPDYYSVHLRAGNPDGKSVSPACHTLTERLLGQSDSTCADVRPTSYPILQGQIASC
jgi:hypothetical protein